MADLSRTLFPGDPQQQQQQQSVEQAGLDAPGSDKLPVLVTKFKDEFTHYTDRKDIVVVTSHNIRGVEEPDNDKRVGLRVDRAIYMVGRISKREDISLSNEFMQILRDKISSQLVEAVFNATRSVKGIHEALNSIKQSKEAEDSPAGNEDVQGLTGGMSLLNVDDAEVKGPESAADGDAKDRPSPQTPAKAAMAPAGEGAKQQPSATPVPVSLASPNRRGAAGAVLCPAGVAHQMRQKTFKELFGRITGCKEDLKKLEGLPDYIPISFLLDKINELWGKAEGQPCLFKCYYLTNCTPVRAWIHSSVDLRRQRVSYIPFDKLEDYVPVVEPHEE